MDTTQQAFAEFVSREVKENANPYPTAIQAFKAGIKAERARVLSELEQIMDKRRNTAEHQGGPFSVHFAHTELQQIIGKDDK